MSERDALADAPQPLRDALRNDPRLPEKLMVQLAHIETAVAPQYSVTIAYLRDLCVWARVVGTDRQPPQTENEANR